MDVNTIFYFFSGTKDEYNAEWLAGKINPRTIVFIASTGEIYKNNIRYSGLSLSEVRNEATTIVNNNPYDDSLITASIETLFGLIDALNQDIDSLITDKQNDIKDIIGSVLSEYTWLKENLGDVFHLSEFIDELNSYLTTNGYFTTNSATWTTLLQSIDSITGRVNVLEYNKITEAMIKAWIQDGVSQIDLTTYALKSDIDGLITLDDVRDNFESLVAASSSFLTLRSDIDEALAILGTWSRTYSNNTVTDLLAALQMQVNTLQNSVTTTLSTTVRLYLDEDLANGIGDYLLNQSGVLLRSDLDDAVAALFSQTTKSLTETAVEGVANQIINTAGVITQSNLDGAMATIFASSSDTTNVDAKVFYCDGEDTSEAVATFSVDSGQSLTTGSYYSATELATILGTTAATIIEATSPLIVSSSTGTISKYKIVKVSDAEGALASSKLYAAIQVGVKNDASFIRAVADNVTIDADQINLNGETWAEVLHVDQLLTDSIKSSDGSSILVSYLVDKMEENALYTVDVINGISGHSFTDYGITCTAIPGSGTYQGFVRKFATLTIKMECYANYSLEGNFKITMGSRDITGKYATYSTDFGSGSHRNVITINIPSVTGNITVTVLGVTNTGTTWFGFPKVVNIHGHSSSITLTGMYETNDITEDYDTGNHVTAYPVAWSIDTNPSGITIASGNAFDGTLYWDPVITIDPTAVSTGTYTIMAEMNVSSTTNTQYVSDTITIVDDANLSNELYFVNFIATFASSVNKLYRFDNVDESFYRYELLRPYSKQYITYAGWLNTLIPIDKNGAPQSFPSSATVTYSINASYSSYATISGNTFTALKPGCVPVTMTVSGITSSSYSITRYIWIKQKMFGNFNTSMDIYADIFGNSDRDHQIVQYNDNKYLTKNIPYDRTENRDYYLIYLGPYVDVLPRMIVDTDSVVPSWIEIPEGYDRYVVIDGNLYFKFRISSYSAATTHYNNINHEITIADQYQSRSGLLIIESDDGSILRIYITQSGKFGFYDMMKDTVHNCVSAYYITPKYHWKNIGWFATEPTIMTDIYPNAILIPSGKWSCVASADSSFGITNDYCYMGDDRTANSLTLQMQHELL